MYSLKTSKWSLTGHVLYFQAAADPEVTSHKDPCPPGSSFDDLIHRMNSSLHPLCLGSSWVDWEPQGTWSASQINIMELIDQLKFIQGTDFECTHSFFVCYSLRSKITSFHSLLHTWISVAFSMSSCLYYCWGQRKAMVDLRQLAPVLEIHVDETFLKILNGCFDILGNSGLPTFSHWVWDTQLTQL